MTTQIRIALYALLVAAIFAAGTAFGVSHWYKPEHEAHLKDNAADAAFKAQLAIDGKQAELDKKSKEKTYADNLKTALADRDAALSKLRTAAAANSSRGKLSSQPTAPAGSSQVCIDSTAYNAAFSRYTKRYDAGMAGINGLVTEGDSAQIDAQTILQGWPK